MRSASSFLVLLGLVPGCFHPDYECRLLCTDKCPIGYECQETANGKVCGRIGGRMCEPPPPAPSLDAAAPPPRDAGPDSAAPEMLCLDQDQCLTLSPAMRAGLVLWLDPTTLPPMGVAVDSWPDRSGLGNHAQAAASTNRPLSSRDGVLFDPAGAGFRIAHHESIDVGSEGFAVFVVGRMSRRGSCFVTKYNDEPASLLRGFAVNWVLQAGMFAPTVQFNDRGLRSMGGADLADTGPHLVVAVRVQEEVHLRVDGTGVARPAMIASSTSLSNRNDLFIGACNDLPPALSGIGAVVLVRGAISPLDLTELERFLMKRFAIDP